MFALKNLTGTPLIVTGADGAPDGAVRLVPPGSKVVLSPSKAPWSVAFADGARPFGTLRRHVLTGAPFADTNEKIKPTFTIDCGAGAPVPAPAGTCFVASRLPSPSPSPTPRGATP